MKRRHFLISLGALLCGARPALADDTRLISAIRQVESGGNDRAIGDGGRARGPYQCHRAAWADACAYGKVQWDYETLAFSEPHARQAMIWYWARYKATTDESKARCWNGGPKWSRNPSATDAYWRKVQRAMR